MKRPRSIPPDDVFPNDLVTVITRNPPMVLRGNAGPLVLINGNLFLILAVKASTIRIELCRIDRIERHRKTTMGRGKEIPCKRTFKRWLRERQLI